MQTGTVKIRINLIRPSKNEIITSARKWALAARVIANVWEEDKYV